MFVCAHPAIDPAVRAPLMLQTVLGLDAARIASAFLVAPATHGRSAWCAPSPRSARPASPSRCRGRDELPQRLDAVLEAIYAAFGTGWDDVAGTDPRARRPRRRSDLARPRLSSRCCPTSGRGARPAGADAASAQRAARRAPRRARATTCRSRDRTRRSGTRDASPRPRRSCTAPPRSPRPARSSSRRRSSRRTRQRRLGASVADAAIVALYDALVAMRPTIGAIVSRACAVGAAHGAAAGRAALAALPAKDVDGYQPYWAALAHLAAAEGDVATARAARERAVGLSTDPAVRRFLLRGTERR